ncbi:MAG: sugar transferase [Acutalibacteraceae bacterium]|jgi:exopolysaccharide biosynthesis polyprenyl glycosylphosphotransferase|nr:sugar transferase [Clostridiales bacterium]
MQKNYDQFKKIIIMAMSIAIFGLVILAFAYVWYTDYNYNLMTGDKFFNRKGNWLIIALYGLMQLFFTKIYGGFKVGYYKISNIIYSQMLSITLVNALIYFVISLVGRELVDLTPIFKLTFIDAFIIVAWTYVVSKIYEQLFPPRKLLVIYSNHNATTLIRKMCQRSDKYQICEAISIDEGLEQIKHRIDEYDGAIICDAPGKIRNDILKYCFETSKRTYITPKISDVIIRGADELNLFDTPILLCRNRGLSMEQRLVKRFFDITLSLIALVVLSPILLIIAIAIKLYDHGPVFFTQERVTIDGKKFKIYKFRSMIVDAEKDGHSIPATDNDPRITPVGKIIRKTRFDEFPQLINIIKGDMSIVGPRPERVEHVEEYAKEMPEFRYRTKVKAGLTGYAQIYGKYNTTAYDKLKLDMMYIENYSLRLDFQLIIMTVKVLFMKESTEGFDDDEQNK